MIQKYQNNVAGHPIYGYHEIPPSFFIKRRKTAGTEI